MKPDPVGESRTFRELLKDTVGILEKADIAEAESDAWLLFEKAFSLDRTSFLMRRDEEADPGKLRTLREMVNERLNGRPVQYILGETWFCGYRFHVTEDVLIPRFDTEVLVEAVKESAVKGQKALDLCTGSGCIIITLAKDCGLDGCGTDISEKALAAARRNNEELAAGCTFIKSDIFENITGKYDIIVSNPPYIRTAVIETLQREVRDFEPRLALDGGDDGLELYRRIAAGAPQHLVQDGLLFLEIGYDQAADVTKILEENGFSDIRTIRDLAGKDRVIKAISRSSYV